MPFIAFYCPGSLPLEPSDVPVEVSAWHDHCSMLCGDSADWVGVGQGEHSIPVRQHFQQKYSFIIIAHAWI